MSLSTCYLFFFNDTATTEIYPLSLHDALPIYPIRCRARHRTRRAPRPRRARPAGRALSAFALRPPHAQDGGARDPRSARAGGGSGGRVARCRGHCVPGNPAQPAGVARHPGRVERRGAGSGGGHAAFPADYSCSIFAFAGGLLAVAMVYWIGSRLRGHDPLLALVLTGVVVGTLLGAVVSLLKTLADPLGQLPAITFWLLGSLASVAPRELAVAAPLAVAGLIPLVLLRWRVNLLTLPDDEARTLGADPGRLRLLVIAAATLMTAAAVAISGIIG